MPFVVVYDANVLYPNVVRDLLIRIAQAGLVQAKWTHEILDETFRALLKNRPDTPDSTWERLRELMLAAIRDGLVMGHEPLVDAITGLPDADDRHVVAAAIKSKAQVIVTANIKDFPAHELAKWNVEAKHPDAFIVDQIHLDPRAVYAAVQQIADSRTNPPGTVTDVLDELARAGLVEAVAALR